MIFEGSACAVATPFTEDGVDFDALTRLLEYQIENGTDALVTLGTTGEPATMTEAEKDAVIAHTFRTVGGRIPVIVGVGGNNTREAARKAAEARDKGAAGVLAVTPYYNKCSAEGLLAHFTMIADTGQLPVIVYNVPSRTCVNITPGQFSELLDHPHIAGIKEASGDISQVAQMAGVCGTRGAIYSGNDDQVVPVLALGGSGVISVAANIIPGFMHEMTAAFLEGNHKKAREMQLTAAPLIQALFSEVNPIPVKQALSLMGLSAGGVRLPLTPLSEEKTQLLRKEMEAFGLIGRFSV